MASDDRHAALIERDRWVGLEAEAAAAREHASRLQAELDIARMRLERKNARIKALVARVRELEEQQAATPPSTGLRARLRRRS